MQLLRGVRMTDAQIQAAIDRYDCFLTDLYHERLNPKEPRHEEDFDLGHGDDGPGPC